VFPFRNQTGDASRDYLENASVNLLTLAAAHWRDMRVYDDERTASLLKRRGITRANDLDFESAQAMAREASVGTLVLGDIRREGDSLAIEAKVHDVRTGDRIGTHLVRASFDADPRPLFDQLAARILGTSGAPPGERPTVLAQTTSSLEAYRSYLLGTAALQRFEVDTARKHLLRAVALDSTFALAYIRLRDVEGWSIGGGQGGGNPALQRNWVMTAERHSASLPPRLRSLVEYHREYQDGNFRRAREIAQGLIARDSTDVEAWYQLGEAHFHHSATVFPHPDTLGNIGRALRSFERALALDSAYILAYQHILDALNNCAGSNVWVCTGDSATYGTPEELRQRFGDSTLTRIRAEMRRSQIATARGWTVVAPTTLRARQALVVALYQQRMLDEALRETEALARIGGTAQAGLWRAMVLFDQDKPGDAAAALDSLLRISTDTLSMAIGVANTTIPAGILAGGGGRLETANRLNATLIRLLPFDSANGPGGVRISKAELKEFLDGWVIAEVGSPEARGWGRGMHALVLNKARGDTAEVRRLTTANGTMFLSAYLASRDTAMLSTFLARVDTANSSTWRVAEALIALERGDTARARMRVDRHYRNPTATEFTGEAGIVRAYGWGELLSRMKEPRLAIEAFARIDSTPERTQRPGLAVRSLAERGALHQQLGERERAIEYYERFISAWRAADPKLQPMVERAREAVQAIRAGGSPARPPG
jgi:tetratricopeptide (TPR) repeat protein